MRKFVIRTQKDLLTFLKHFNTKRFAFDTETTSLKYMELETEGISLCDGKLACYIVFDDDELPEMARMLNTLELLFNNAQLIAGHNISYDLKVLRKEGISCEKPELFCTMVADHLIDENRRHGLKFLAKELLGHEETESYLDASSEGINTKRFYKYAINDAIWTWELMMYQLPLLKQEGLEHLFRDIEMPFQRVLVDMEVNGMLIDIDKVIETRLKLRDTIDNITLQMCELLEIPYEIAICPEIYDSEFSIYSAVNFNSSDQLANILFTKLELPVIEYTNGGKPSVGKIVIDKLRNSHPFVDLLYKLKKAMKLYTSYFSEDAQIISNLDEDNKVRPSFNDTGTATGRLSCNSPNLQQLPQNSKELGVDTREAFIASPGYKMVAIDYSGQELRVLAQLTQEPALIDTFNKGKDMHLSTANDFFNLGIPEEELYENSDSISELKDRYKDERNKAKCFHPDTEVLTKEGWKKIIDINTNTEIIQAIPERGLCKLEWTNPTEVFTQYHNSGKLISLENEGTSLQVTPDHRMLAFNHKKEHYVTTPQEFNKARYWCNAGWLDDDLIDVTDPSLIQLIVATQADGSYTDTSIRFGFTKQRKIDRMDDILSIYPKNLWSKTKQKKMTTYRLFGYLNDTIKKIIPNKIFEYGLLQIGYKQREVFINELMFWDSHQNKFKRSFTYSSTVEKNTDVIQSICSITSRKTYKRHNGCCWLLSIKDHTTSRGENLKKTEVEFTDKVACLSVPSTFVLVRYNGKTTITGQTINFGMAYGKGAYGFSKDFGITEDEAQGILDKYFAALPKVKEAIERSHEEVRTNGFVKSMTGRRRRFTPNPYGFYPGGAFRQAFNFLIQGYSADMIRIAMNKVREISLTKTDWDLKVIATVHDEAVYEVREEYVDEAMKEIQKAFETAVEFVIPVVAEVSKGINYSEAK